ncbi:MAG: transglycosylase SLT domain-containing protein [Myxococcaceae bacterium]|nr:transglycosylase SLT domain-containing protein [Myxococcaceae bacterium]MCA3015973.1 transglycosylase SLT domain-containing protein [Myxococcaceae bacterium]
MCGWLALCLTASSAAAQSPALLDAVRVHAPGLAARAKAELDACQRPCPERARLSLLTGVLTLSEGDAGAAVAQLTSVPAPALLASFHGWYLGVAQIYAGQKRQAQATLKRARKAAPRWLAQRIEVRLAELDLDLGQASSARPVLEQRASESPTAEALLSRAYARLATGAGGEAAQDLRAIVLRFPTHPHAVQAMRLLSVEREPTFTFEEQLQRAQALAAQGAPSEALAQLDAIPPPTGKDARGAVARVALARAQALLAKGRDADASAQLDLAIEQGRPSTASEAMMLKARRLMRAQEHEKARATLLALSAAYPDAGTADDAAYLSGWLSLADGRAAQAVADFDAFEARYPNSKKRDEGRWFRAWALFRQGRLAEARDGLSALIDTFPRSSLVPQARYWSTRFAQLGRLGQRSDTSAAGDGGLITATRATTDGGVAIELASEYRDVALAFPGTLYSLLAAERMRELGAEAPRLFTEPPRPLAPAPTPALALATELARAGLFKDAAEEVSRVVGTVTTADGAMALGHALQHLGEFGAAHGLAARWLWGQVYTARRPEALALMYPRAYRAVVEVQAAEVGLDPFLAWAIMRRESGFRPDVVSSADARGLMQIIPPTARQIAQELRRPTPAPDELYSPELNVRLGIWYLAALLERMGHPALCAASYNAGPSAVSRWTTQRGALPLDEFIEEIPFKETRGYVKQVLADAHLYRALYGGAPAPLALTLPTPRSSGVAF